MAVTNLPSLPTSGELLASNLIFTAGGEILICGIGNSSPIWQIVPPMAEESIPVMATISPA